MKGKINQKLAENRRRLLESEATTSLESIVQKGFEYQFVPMDVSNQLLQVLLANELEGTLAEYGFISALEASELLRPVLENANQSGDDVFYLFFEANEEAGAIELRLTDCLHYLNELLTFIRFDEGELMNSFMLAKADLSFVVCIFHTEYGTELFCL